MERGSRHNRGKLRYDLVSPKALRHLVEVYTMGAEKYDDRNWERGLPLMETFASLQRHAWAWAEGEDLDPESGLHHMAHVMWNAAAILHFYGSRPDLDDRPA
ncbi:MAG: DUF5664 domain-containing protein [Deltaproteobacteria bacterium]|nr:DUF5664 domain-containing protein [Deltaproteobacteria bacterium]